MTCVHSSYCIDNIVSFTINSTMSSVAVNTAMTAMTTFIFCVWCVIKCLETV